MCYNKEGIGLLIYFTNLHIFDKTRSIGSAFIAVFHLEVTVTINTEQKLTYLISESCKFKTLP